jgi:hypothetical protein
VKSLLARARLVRTHDLTLGTLFERLAAVHGDRPLVEEIGDEPLSLTYTTAAAPSPGGRPPSPPPPAPVTGWWSPSPTPTGCCSPARRWPGPGAVPVPVNDRMRADEVDHVVADSGAAVVLRDADELEGGATVVRPAVASDAGDVAALFYTSGTTGKPKGARLTNRALVGQLGGGALWPPGSAATRPWSPCPSPTSWASPRWRASPWPASRSASCPGSAP